MDMGISWSGIISGAPAWFSLFGLVVAALHICWRAGSLHPLNNRLLRLFISRDDIQDELVKKNLSDYSALSVFRMTYGVSARTLHDARGIIFRAETKNIPLDLVGRAGLAFDLDEFVVNKKKRPGRSSVVIAGVLIYLFFCLAMVAGISATEDRLLVSLKSTGTRLWLSNDTAQPAFQMGFGERTSLSSRSCQENEKKRAKDGTPQGFSSNDYSILCGIWRDPSTKNKIRNDLYQQRWTLLVATFFCIWVCVFFYPVIRSAVAVRELERLLGTEP